MPRRVDLVKTAAVICGTLLLFLVPCLHLGIVSGLVYSVHKPEVDVENCANTCWDTKFKGDYETLPAAYKHIYFNITRQTLQIWFCTVLFMVAFYETVKRFVYLILKCKLRFSMFVLFVSVFYSHYYTWWSLFNYLNDDFYDQWYHQMYFSITELISTVCVVYLCNRDNSLYPKLLLLIIDIALFHIITSAGDQFVTNIFLNSGEFYQMARDLGFMIPDLMHVSVAGYYFVQWYRKPGHSVTTSVGYDFSPDVITRFDTILSFIFIISLSLFVRVL